MTANVTVAKMTAFAVRGAPAGKAAVSKVVAYAVVVPNGTVPAVFNRPRVRAQIIYGP